jgi:glutaredoxin-related protein
MAHRARKKYVTFTACNITNAVKIIKFYLKLPERGKYFEELQGKFGICFLRQ